MGIQREGGRKGSPKNRKTAQKYDKKTANRIAFFRRIPKPHVLFAFSCDLDDLICHCRALNPKQREHRDVAARIGKARVAFVVLKNIWASKVISTRSAKPQRNTPKQASHLQLQREVGSAVWGRNLEEGKDNAAESSDIYQHMSKAHL